MQRCAEATLLREKTLRHSLWTKVSCSFCVLPPITSPAWSQESNDKAAQQRHQYLLSTELLLRVLKMVMISGICLMEASECSWWSAKHIGFFSFSKYQFYWQLISLCSFAPVFSNGKKANNLPFTPKLEWN